MDEARKSVPAEVAGILEAAGWKRKEIFSYLSKKRARGLGYDEVGKEVFLSDPEPFPTGVGMNRIWALLS